MNPKEIGAFLKQLRVLCSWDKHSKWNMLMVTEQVSITKSMKSENL